MNLDSIRQTYRTSYNSSAERLRIEKRGDFVYLFLGNPGKDLHYSTTLALRCGFPLEGAYYVGIGVCSHDKDAAEEALFANVDPAGDLAPVGKTTLYSTLERIRRAST
ncbi:MAG TPA: hypothetical protein VIX14_00665 [Terriglobales bacterium]